MRKPFILKLIIVNTFLAPLSLYSFRPDIPALPLAIATAVYVPLALALHKLNPKARIAALVLSYIGVVLTAFDLLAPTGSIQVLAAIALGSHLFTAWYLHRNNILYLFDPDSYDPWAHWRKPKKQ